MRYFALILYSFVTIMMIGPATAQLNDKAITNSRQVIENQIAAFHKMDHEAAFSYAAPRLQVIFRDVDNFITMVKRGYKQIYAAKSWSYGRNRIDGKTIHHEVLITGPNDKEWRALYSLQQQDNGEWKITGVRLLKSNASAI